jgi:hypothetical protein
MKVRNDKPLKTIHTPIGFAQKNSPCAVHKKLVIAEGSTTH